MKEQFQRLCDLEQENANLKAQLYRQSPYKIALNGCSVFIPQSKHKLGSIKSYLVKDSDGNVVEVAVKIFSDNSVQIDSNLTMDNLTLILF
jgi:hypothetical protein